MNTIEPASRNECPNGSTTSPAQASGRPATRNGTRRARPARGNRSDSIRQLGWIFAASQLLVLCVPIALKIVEWAAIGVIALLAIAALIFLFTERP